LLPIVPIFTFLEPAKVSELNAWLVIVVIVLVVDVEVVFVLLLVIVTLGTKADDDVLKVNVPIAGMLTPEPEIVTVDKLVSVIAVIVLLPVPVCVSLIVKDVCKSPVKDDITTPAVPLIFSVDKLVSLTALTVCTAPVKDAFDVIDKVPMPFVTVCVVAASLKLIVPKEPPADVALICPDATLTDEDTVPKVKGKVAEAPVVPVTV